MKIQTIQKAPTGSVVGKWRERTGDQRIEVKVDPSRSEGTEFRVDWSRRWGYQLGDVREGGFWLPREGVEQLRDALNAALDWSPAVEPTPETER